MAMRVFRREAPYRILPRQLHVKMLLVVAFHSPAILLARPHRVSTTPRTPTARFAGRAREGETHDNHRDARQPQDLPPVMAFAHARGAFCGVRPRTGRAWTVAVCVALSAGIVEAVRHHQARATIVPSRRHLHLLRAGASQ